MGGRIYFFHSLLLRFSSVWVIGSFGFNYLMNSKYGFGIQFCAYDVNCGKSVCVCERSRCRENGWRQTRGYVVLHKDSSKNTNNVTSKISSG